MPKDICLSCRREWKGAGLHCPKCMASPPKGMAAVNVIEPPCAIARMPFPGKLEFTLPWTALSPDNENKGVAGAENRARAASFKAAKLKAAELMRGFYDGEPFAGPARVVFTFWFPDNRPRDPVNFGKALLDAMKGIIVTDDKWQVCRSVAFEGEDIDRDRPRCEVTVSVKV